MSKKTDKKPDMHEELDGFNIKINSFGEIQSNFEIDKLNKFLDDKVEDKKLNNSVDEEE